MFATKERSATVSIKRLFPRSADLAETAGGVAITAAQPPQDLDQELATLMQSERHRRQDRLVIGTGALAMVLLAVTFTVYAGKIKDAEEGQAEAETASAAQLERLARLDTALEEQGKRVTELTASLKTARGETDKAEQAVLACRAAAEAKPDTDTDKPATAASTEVAARKPLALHKRIEARRSRESEPRKASSRAPTRLLPTSTTSGGKCQCKAGDPLCGCL